MSRRSRRYHYDGYNYDSSSSSEDEVVIKPPVESVPQRDPQEEEWEVAMDNLKIKEGSFEALKVLGGFGNLWEVLGSFGNFWEILGRKDWEGLGSFEAGRFGQEWEGLGEMGEVGRFWEVLGEIGSFWELGSFGRYCEDLGGFGKFWARIDRKVWARRNGQIAEGQSGSWNTVVNFVAFGFLSSLPPFFSEGGEERDKERRKFKKSPSWVRMNALGMQARVSGGPEWGDLGEKGEKSGLESAGIDLVFLVFCWKKKKPDPKNVTKKPLEP